MHSVDIHFRPYIITHGITVTTSILFPEGGNFLKLPLGNDENTKKIKERASDFFPTLSEFLKH